MNYPVLKLRPSSLRSCAAAFFRFLLTTKTRRGALPHPGYTPPLVFFLQKKLEERCGGGRGGGEKQIKTKRLRKQE